MLSLFLKDVQCPESTYPTEGLSDGTCLGVSKGISDGDCYGHILEVTGKFLGYQLGVSNGYQLKGL